MFLRVVLSCLLLSACAQEMASSDPTPRQIAAASALQGISQGYFAMAAAQQPVTVTCLGCY